jgi:hypothetical protein
MQAAKLGEHLFGYQCRRKPRPASVSHRHPQHLRSSSPTAGSLPLPAVLDSHIVRLSLYNPKLVRPLQRSVLADASLLCIQHFSQLRIVGGPSSHSQKTPLDEMTKYPKLPS